MEQPLFLRIVEAVEGFNKYFTHWPGAVGKWGLKPIMKITATLQMLAYGAAANFNDEYLQLSESTSLESMD